MPHAIERRLFLQTVASFSATAACLPSTIAQQTEKAGAGLRVGIMGIRRGSRGSALASAFLAQGAEIAYVCDVDSRAHEGAIALVQEKQSTPPVAVQDFRKILDDSKIDILVCAAPNHWHAPATILGCKAGKHVYVEKPCSHTAEEGELALAAARKNKRIVQMGTQRRSWPTIQEAIERIHRGEIGRVLYARTWYNNRRPNIGVGKIGDAPEWLNWRMWQGIAPERPYKDNLVHYNWHWHWHYGNGELGNNGVHAIDVARWGLQVAFPTRISSSGGKYRHDDDQETPDTNMVTFDFPEQKTITWEGLSWSAYGPGGSSFGVSFHGEKGTIVIVDAGYKLFDEKNKELETRTGQGGDLTHVANFLTCVKDNKLPNADIEQAHRSTLLCHLGNIAYRTQSTLLTNSANGHILENANAEKLWSREYHADWEKQVKEI
jgi:predicted dehydrogenase